jgi:hypothetical protein
MDSTLPMKYQQWLQGRVIHTTIQPMIYFRGRVTAEVAADFFPEPSAQRYLGLPSEE